MDFIRKGYKKKKADSQPDTAISIVDQPGLEPGTSRL